MHPEIKKAIELIDRQISELKRAKGILQETFGEKDTQGSEEEILVPFPKQKKVSRKETIIKLLQESGSLTRGEIRQKTNIPLGTISMVLNDKASFKNKNGKWHYEGKDNSSSLAGENKTGMEKS